MTRNRDLQVAIGSPAQVMCMMQQLAAVEPAG